MDTQYVALAMSFLRFVCFRVDFAIHFFATGTCLILITVADAPSKHCCCLLLLPTAVSPVVTVSLMVNQALRIFKTRCSGDYLKPMTFAIDHLQKSNKLIYTNSKKKSLPKTLNFDFFLRDIHRKISKFIT